MKRIRIASALLAVAVLAALAILTTTSKHIVRAVYASSGCTDATLTGNYAFSQSGFTTKNTMGSPLPAAAMGVFTLDGAGNFSVTYTDMSPGKPAYIPVQATSSGTYIVNSDCTGSISVTTGQAAGLTYNTVIMGGGTEMFAIGTTPFYIVTFDAKPQ